MIRIRIERDDCEGPIQDGMWWWENGQQVGRVIIEQSILIPSDIGGVDRKWVPVEVIDER